VHTARTLVVRSALVLGLLGADLAVLEPARAASASPPAHRVAWVELDGAPDLPAVLREVIDLMVDIGATPGTGPG
jgi:hypothetical protein